MILRLTTIAVIMALGASCAQTQQSQQPSNSSTNKVELVEIVQDESQKANDLFERVFEESLARSPIYLAYLGRKTDNDKWDNLSQEYLDETLELSKQQLVQLHTINKDDLDANTLVSYQLLEQALVEEIEDDKWRLYDYPVNQMFGTHSTAPSVLINQHQLDSLADAHAYIARLNALPLFFSQLIDSLEKRANAGIIAPKFVFPHVIRTNNNIIKGAPFSQDNNKDSTLFADFKTKVSKLAEKENIDKDALIKQAKNALLNSVKPAYLELNNYLSQLQEKADNKDGAWKFPDGKRFYNVALERTTTTNLSAQEIHQIGLNEVKRIHQEMSEIKNKVGFKGDLKAFMAFMRTDKQFYYPETAEGKQRYLDEATALIDNMKTKLDSLFTIKPKADLTVKAVEAFREQSAGKAFYQPPAEDGSRPGLYYANLYKMSEMPSYQMEALAYHEGLPGHHMQLAISQELKDMPKFRRFGGYTAYIEGWGLYSEYIPKEIGLYSDPYSDFGRLAMELWRACRLVVDTGIHAMKWDREKAINYYIDNTPNPKADGVKMVERHIVMPSQATAYKIGMLKILELREMSKKRLGDKFDIREFHDLVLKNGAVPLNVLENYVEQWIAKKQ